MIKKEVTFISQSCLIFRNEATLLLMSFSVNQSSLVFTKNNKTTLESTGFQSLWSFECLRISHGMNR